MADRIWRAGAAVGCLLAACGGRAETQSPAAGGSGTTDTPGPLRPAPSGGASNGGSTWEGGGASSGGTTWEGGGTSSGGTTWEGGGTGNVGGTSSAGDIGWNDFGGTSNAGTSNAGTSSAGTGGIETPEQMELAALRLGVIGAWFGTRTDWLGGPPCNLALAFTADGHYSAHSSGGSCVVFYYGTDDDSPEKTYLIDDITAASEGTGEITIYFSPGDTNAGTLKHIALSSDGAQLSFQVWKGQYGPLTFSLHR